MSVEKRFVDTKNRTLSKQELDTLRSMANTSEPIGITSPDTLEKIRTLAKSANAKPAKKKRRTLKANESARILGEDMLEQVHAGNFVLRRNPEKFAITKANVQNINPLPDTLTNANPMADPAQRVFEKKDTGTAPSYSAFVSQMAFRIAEKYIRNAKSNCSHLRADFQTEIASSVGLNLAALGNRFPHLTMDLLPRFACNALPSEKLGVRMVGKKEKRFGFTIQKFLVVSAFKACDARLRHMAKNIPSIPEFLDSFDSNVNSDTKPTLRVSDREKLQLINLRCDGLADTLALKLELATNNKQRGAIHAAGKLVERAREVAKASVQSEAVSFTAPLSFVACVDTVSHLPRDNGKIAGKRQTFRMANGHSVSHSTLWKKAERLGALLEVDLVRQKQSKILTASKALLLNAQMRLDMANACHSIEGQSEGGVTA